MKKEQTVKKNDNKKTLGIRNTFFPEMHTRAAAVFFFLFATKRVMGVFETGRKVLSTTPDTRASCDSLPVPAGLLQFALLSRVEMKNDRPRKRPASKTALSL